jgi:hypothetical protein
MNFNGMISEYKLENIDKKKLRNDGSMSILWTKI